MVNLKISIQRGRDLRRVGTDTLTVNVNGAF